MTNIRKTVPWGLLGALAITTLITACGGDDGDGDSPTRAATVAAPATSAPSAAASVVTSGQSASGEVLKVADTKLGKVLTDAAGMTLYIFKNDTAGNGTSACTGGCATTWPPMTVPDVAPARPAGVTGDLATITRGDSTKQVTYNGLPLYRYAGDKAPGDATGQGVGGVWFVATVGGAAATPTSTTDTGSGYGSY